MTRSFAVFIFACISLGPALAVANGSRRPNSSTPCSQVRIEGEITPKLNDSELRWICGDSKSAAYRDVPPYQAAFHMRSFLDNRGYVLAEFKIENGILVVHPGEAVKVATIEVTPPDAKLEQIAGRFRGKPLRPSLLNAMESSLQRQLLETGYSCATVASQARAGDVSLKVVPGPMSDFSAFSADSIPGLESEALERFRPFEKDSTYDIRLVELYEKRLLRDNIVQGTYFTENCKNLETAIQQSFLLGPPRTLRFGVGIDTENGPLLQLSWRHHRFSRMAAQANLTIQTSLSEQSLVGRAEIFPWRSRPRLSVTPELRLVRKRTDDMVQITNTLQTLSTKTWDAASSKWTLSAGPAFVWERYQTAAASRYLQESSLALLANAEVRTHTFEIYDAHPQDGSLLGVSAEYRDRALGFPDRTWKVSGEGRFISALGECGKGHCVAAFRLSASNTWTSADSIDTLPPSLRTYLGGFESLRGFGLTKIPDNNGNGALSSVASGIELRGVDLFIARWEPYVFFDIGATGTKTSHLDAPNYYTSGLGLRWSSPIGMIQGYISRPSVGDFYAYASFGGEF